MKASTEVATASEHRIEFMINRIRV